MFPFDIQQKIKNKKIIIIPDNDLQNIPFEALITKENTNQYLIKTNEISYVYSLSFLKENSSIVRKPKNNFVGFAPISFNYDSLLALNNSNEEISKIKKLIGGETYSSNNATKATFLNTSNQYNILHLATHANANDSISPWIAFKNKKLQLHELYNSKNQANLVVLSACNTSIGKIANGEGTLSLARGFFYAGANSIISSLWNVNDKATQEITTSFYKHLKTGKTKSAALRNAKLDYLNTHSLSEASPYYWSSLILIGDNSAINFANYNWIYVLVLSTLLFFVFLFIKKIKK